MEKEDSQNFIFYEEFLRIFKSFESQVDIRCLDLHSIQMALTNFPDMKQVKVPATYISYLLKKTSNELQNEFASYTKENIQSMLSRINNYFAQNILYSAEEHLIDGLILLRAIQAQTTTSFPLNVFKEQLENEKAKNRTFGTLGREIKAVVARSGDDIIPADCPYYSYLENYVTLRNCFTHRAGKITEKEKDLEIRLPIISQEQIDGVIESVKAGKKIEQVNPQTGIKKWEQNDTVNLTLLEVEGIAYGLLKTLFQIIKHMYKAADRHVESLDKEKETKG